MSSYSRAIKLIGYWYWIDVNRFAARPWFTRLSDHWHTYVYVIMIDLSSSVQWNLCVGLLHLLYACVNKRRFTYREDNRRSVIINVRCIARLERFTFHRESKGKSSSLLYHALQWIFLISCASDNSEYFFKSRERDWFFFASCIIHTGILGVMKIIKMMRNNWMEFLHRVIKLRLSTKITYSRWTPILNEFLENIEIDLVGSPRDRNRGFTAVLANDHVCMHTLCWHIVCRLMLAAASDFGCCGIGIGAASCIGELSA